MLLGQRCAGRNYNGRRCCTPENPCGEGEGDCDGPDDGGLNDGHAGCRGDLVCGSNNCKQFGHYYHEKDDCCERPSSVQQDPYVAHQHHFSPPQKPPHGIRRIMNMHQLNFHSSGQRCSGRHHSAGDCCSAAEPCVEGEGDCDGDQDCRGGLVCGDNNCRQFGDHFHPKDDCCQVPAYLDTPKLEPKPGIYLLLVKTPISINLNCLRLQVCGEELRWPAVLHPRGPVRVRRGRL